MFVKFFSEIKKLSKIQSLFHTQILAKISHISSIFFREKKSELVKSQRSKKSDQINAYLCKIHVKDEFDFKNFLTFASTSEKLNLFSKIFKYKEFMLFYLNYPII
ncbi:hypothetical protein BpHYR1_037172 [Brachionus plicatilis]|uniref:Uncharacterized protein n=1 Tax=Brachionus plicatilis TaxID=10195 RepID=A0A3M7REM9_BRAPC|nr:hypothetical protein BpHYR1_037172 [Brachionus plicatilis]